ncbi:MAG: dephospho-CoA kinase [Pseudoalteromonas sp.]|uniref:dephospho-CoA kinase n=1 Tax=unclassified Pseudoalteromonas TaxID=194690 RepID=UPI003F95D5C3
MANTTVNGATKNISINKWTLGLTGGIGCGKSAVSAIFEAQGITIVDADIIAREVVAPKSDGLNAIIEHFGSDILNQDQTLNRSKLRALIFAEQVQKTWLNNLLHPLIRKKIQTDLNSATSPYVILVAPLLFENGLDKYCQRTLLIDVPVAVQLTRTIKRDNISKVQAQAIIDAQMSRSDKKARAIDVINNNQPLKDVSAEVLKYHQHYLKLAVKS